MTETTIITTQVRSSCDDFDIRREFCGFQDERLNDLRLRTSCIIDLQTHGTKDPFEKVTWIISHYDPTVRAFVVKRLQTWSKTTEITVQMHLEDIAFHQQNLSDVSSCSTDHKAQQLGYSAKSSPSPPRSSVPVMFNKRCKTPLHDYYFHNVPNAALVPQTDLQSRNQPRRRRNSSSSSSGIRRPALFGKPSDSYFSRVNDYPRSRYSPLSTPASKVQSVENGFSLAKPPISIIENEESFDISKLQDTAMESDVHGENDINLEEEARWSNLLSDTSDFESGSVPLMADIILVSRLRECLINSQITLNDDIEYAQKMLPSSLSITSIERLKTLNNKPVWFHRLLLDSKIILSNGIHQSRSKAQKLAYKKMIELITNQQGIEPKVISNGRCKVALRKTPPAKQLNETTINDSVLSPCTPTDDY